MNKITCKDIFEDVLFLFNGKNPIGALADSLEVTPPAEPTINSYLYDILVTDEQPLTIDYLLNRYDRIMSPLFLRLYEHHEESLAFVCAAVSNIIKMKYLYNWNKLAEAMFSDYNPIENYSMVENKETDFTEQTTDNTSTTQKYNGFNADEMKDVSESVIDGDITKTDTGSKAKNELTRKGNIGVTTSQQMIESEYKLRKKNLLDVIYRDIDSILFIDYYN